MTLRSPLVWRYAPRYSHAALSWQFDNSALPTLTLPFGLDDWPNPYIRPPFRSVFSIFPSRTVDVASPFNQDDWPNPLGAKGLKADQLGYIDSTEFWLFGSIIPVPFNQGEWTNPLRPRNLGTDFYDFNGLLPQPNPFYQTDWFTSKGQQGLKADQLGFVQSVNFWAFTPFNQDDWPNPKGQSSNQLRIFSDSYKLTLIGQDTFFGTAGQSPVYDWPNPQQPRRLRLDFTQSVNFWAFTPFNQNDWINPTPPRGLKADQLGFTYSTAFWSIPSAAPFNLLDWPNPQRYRALQFGFNNPTAFWSITAAFPFNYNDWPNPQRQRGLQIGFVDFYKLSLIGQDQFFGAPGQGPVYDWPNPQRPRQRNEFGSSDYYKVLLNAVPPEPFYLLDWPNPKGARGLQIGFVDSYKLFLIGQDKFFGAAGQSPVYNWPNPRGPQQRNEFGFVQYQTSLYVTFQPFALLDWPNPQRSTYRETGSTLPFAFWRLTPFNVTDWPNPKGARGPQIGSVDSYKLTLIGQDSFFGGAGKAPVYDWPNPKGPRQRNEFGFVLPFDNSLYASFISTATPFYQTHWPNPRGPINLSNITYLRLSYTFSFVLEPDRVATTSAEIRSVSVSFENRIGVVSAQITAMASTENRTATTSAENRTPIAPKDTDQE